MLPFGSLSTQLPLLIIGALYMFYIGVGAVNKEKSNLSEDNLQIMEISNSGAKVDYFTLAAMPFHSPAEKTEHFFIAHTNFFVKNIIFPNKEDFSKISFYDFRIFSRPPPIS